MAEASQEGADKLAAELEEARRRIAELEAYAAERALSHVTDTMLDGFSLLSADGVHLDVNPALCAMTGFSRDELIGSGPPHPYWPPEEKAAIEATLAQTLTGEPETFALTFMCKDGGRFPVLVTPSVVRDPAGEIVCAYATVKDVSEQERRQAALAESEALFRLTFEQAPMGATIVGPDFCFQRVNARFAQMTGYSVDELLERGFPDITHPDDVAADVAEMTRLAAGQIDEYAREKRYVRKDGSVAWGDIIVRPLKSAAGERVAFVAMIADISERKRAGDELARLLSSTQAEKERLSALIGSINDEVWLVDAEGRFTLANPAALQAFGEHVADDSAVVEVAAGLEILREDGTPRPPQEAPPLRALAGEVVRNQLEIVRTPESGELRHRLVNATPLRDAGGAITGCVCVVRDVTEVRRAEEAARREREKALSYADIAGVMLVAIAADQTVIFANRKTCEVLERDEAGIVGRNWFDAAVPGDEREQIRGGFAQLMADNVAPWEHVENRVVTSSGEEKLIAWRNTVVRDEGGTIAATLSSGEDITERRRREDALRRSEEHFHSLVENTTDVVARYDLDLRFAYVSPAMSRYTSTDPQDLVGKTQREAGLPGEVADALDRALRSALESRAAVQVDVALDMRIGQVHLEARVFPELDAQGDPSGAVALFRDITERRRTELLLAAPSEILAILASGAPVRETVENIVAALKRATGFDAVGLRLQEGEDFPFIGAQGYSDEFLATENILAMRYPDGGLCRDADGRVSLECTCGLVVSGKTDPANPLFTAGGSAWTNDSLPFLDVPPEEDPRLNPRNRCIHVGFLSIALVPLRSGDAILGLLHLGDRRKDRFTPESIRFFEGLAASIGVALRERQAQEALGESETKYRIVADNTYDWEWWTAPDGTYVYVSPGCERITGHSPGEFTADAGLLERLTHPADCDALRKHLAEGATPESQSHELVFRIQTSAGEERVVEHRCRPVFGADGAYLGRRGSNRDITERERAEDEIRRLNEQLAERYISRTEQMEAATRELEALAYSVAHDVRTPLRTIDGFSAMLIEDERERLSPEGVDELRRVRGAAQTLARLLDELSGLSNVSRRELRRQSVDLTALAQDVGAELAAEDPSRAVELSVEPRLTADGDPALLRLIMRELLENSWKFTRRRDHAHVEVGALDEDGERAFFVRDDGAGFDLRRAEHLFGVFQRMHTSDEFEGDGVGLATVQRLVRRHGGEVWAEAKVDRGATFFFTLPEPRLTA